MSNIIEKQQGGKNVTQNVTFLGNIKNSVEKYRKIRKRYINSEIHINNMTMQTGNTARTCPKITLKS